MRLIAFVSIIGTVVACHGPLFPKCDDPAHPCAPVDPNYPLSERDGVGTPLGDACERLRRFGCPEGYFNTRSQRTCYESYTAASRLAAVPVDCIRTAQSQRDIIACGDANSVRVRCIMPSADEPGSRAVSP